MGRCGTVHRDDARRFVARVAVVNGADPGVENTGEAGHELAVMILPQQFAADFARARATSAAGRDDARLVVVAFDNGGVCAWSMCEGQEQLEWASEILDVARDMIARPLRTETP